MKTLVALLITIFLYGFTTSAHAQFNVGKRIQNKTINRANQRTDQAIDKGLDGVEKGIKGDKNKKDKDQKSENKTDKQTGENKDVNPNTDQGKQDQTSLQSFSKYDFVPGERVIFFDDFSQDAVGDFPALWTANAPGEINTLSIAPGNWFNLNNGEGNYFYLKNVEFPKNFIIEFDIVPKKTGGRIAAGLILYGEDKFKEMDNNPHPGNSGIMISIEKEKWNTMGYKTGESDLVTGSSAVNPVEQEKVNHVIIWVQNRRLRIYHKSAKVLDMPTNIYDGTKFSRFCFRLSRGASCGSYISNFRITDAAPDMRSKLITEGKLVSYGIYFDVNKDVVKPESYGTLKGIADVLQANPDVRVKIVGHTDSDGADAANLDLSKRRGASVKNELVKSFGIDASRLESDGLGETKPVAPNDTPANKAMNRRVEFIKL
jgi:outer membrane protein OmpA-like peptidoglycan-associated protein